jgi:hypothetical protein
VVALPESLERQRPEELGKTSAFIESHAFNATAVLKKNSRNFWLNREMREKICVSNLQKPNLIAKLASNHRGRFCQNLEFWFRSQNQDFGIGFDFPILESTSKIQNETSEIGSPFSSRI